jgi:hypothetical protein
MPATTSVNQWTPRSTRVAATLAAMPTAPLDSATLVNRDRRRPSTSAKQA